MTNQKAKEVSKAIATELLCKARQEAYTDTDAQRDVLEILEDYGLVKKDKMRNYSVDGQMDITSFPEYLPDGYLEL